MDLHDFSRLLGSWDERTQQSLSHVAGLGPSLAGGIRRSIDRIEACGHRFGAWWRTANVS